MIGKLYGIGVGPGEAELLTLKALRIMRESDVIIVPGTDVEKAAEVIEVFLREGKQVAFLTLGDVTIYSTYLYVHHRVAEAGYPVEIVNGIPSFCAVAARLNMGLVEKSEMLHIIPASYQIEEALKLPGTKVLMKAGKQMGHVKELLKQADATAAWRGGYYYLCRIPSQSGVAG